MNVLFWRVALLTLSLGVSTLQSASYHTHSIEGWTVLMDERLWAEDKARAGQALELLRSQLKEIVRVVPAPAVD